MVKCAECGFLALRLSEQWGFVDADESMRKQGSPLRSLVVNYPICFMRRRDILAEIQEYPRVRPDTAEWNSYTVLELGKEIECDAFTEWHQGFTPKEHREMVDREALLEREREWRRDDLAVQKEIAEIARDTAGIQANSMKLQGTALWLAAAGLFASTALGFASLFFRDTGTTNNYYAPPPSATSEAGR